MPAPVRIDDHLLDDIQRRYVTGETIQELAPVAGCSPSTLNRLLRAKGTPMRTKAEATAAALRRAVPGDEVVRRYRGGESTLTLARAFGVSRGVINRVVQEAGEPLRGRSESLVVRQGRATAEQRRTWAAAANEARRDTRDEEGCRRQRAATRASAPDRFRKLGEVELEAMLRDRGLAPIPQAAVDWYNIDLACWPVAVEVHRSGAHPMGREEQRRRLEHLVDAGWRVLYVWMSPSMADARGGIHLTAECADKVVAHIHTAEANPASVREYRVIRSTGEDAP